MGYFRIEGLTVLEDCFECDGEPILASLALEAAESGRFSAVHVLLLSITKQCFAHKYPALLKENIDISEVETYDEFVNLLSSKPLLPAADAIFIDTVTHLIAERFDETVRLLRLTARNKRTVVVRIFAEELSDVFRRNLYCTSDAFLKLRSPTENVSECLFTYSKRTGKRSTRIKRFNIDDHLKFTVTNYEDSGKNNFYSRTCDSVMVSSNSWQFPNVPFDLGLSLSEAEMEAKKSLNLPYLAAQTKSGLSVNLDSRRKVRAGGRIIYTPDDADDFDDSDPDYDLEI